MADGNESRYEKRVDEDWKARARREKEKLAAETAAPKPVLPTVAGPAGAAVSEGSAPPAGGGGEGGANATDDAFVQFIGSLIGEAQMYLGLVAHPATGQIEQSSQGAQQLIEFLRALERKTAGNRSEEEDRIFSQVLPQLQMIYVQTFGTNPAPASAAPAAGAPAPAAPADDTQSTTSPPTA